MKFFLELICVGVFFLSAVESKSIDSQPPHVNDTEKPNESTKDSNEKATPQDCSASIEDFCNEVYSQKNKGNLDLKLGNKPLLIKKGKTDNGFNYSFFNLMK